MNRSTGVLLSISSLPSKYGIGDFGEGAYNFIDFLSSAKQTYWQILPLGPTSFGDSPYQSFSTFAGNPYFISLDEFIEDGLLEKEDVKNIDFGDNPKKVDYAKLYENRYPILKKAYKNSNITEDEDYISFCSKSKWLNDYSLFMAIKDKFGGKAYYEWDKDIKLRKSEAIKKYEFELKEEMNFYKFLQYHFYKQWGKLKSYANKKGVKIIGDIPIYVALDSADTWANSSLFQFDKDNKPISVAGCPPDGFSKDGQLWGNPLYNWKEHKKTGYKWWISRIEDCFNKYDVVRIDHFRGFDEYYSIPYGSETAKEGHWEKGPDMELFKAVEKALGKKEIIAEDLGFVTDSVRKLVKKSGFMNMKVLEFAFDSRDTGSASDYLPHNYNKNCVAYTGTHDNQTIKSWYETISDNEKKLVREYLCDEFTPNELLHKSLIALLMRSKAKLTIIPLQDYLGLRDESRMNIPSTVGANWQWRVESKDLSENLCKEIKHFTILYGREKKGK